MSDDLSGTPDERLAWIEVVRRVAGINIDPAALAPPMPDGDPEELLAFLRGFDYGALPGPIYHVWERAVWQLHAKITDGRNRELASRLIPLMVEALESTDARETSHIDVRNEAMGILYEAPELLEDNARALVRTAVTEDAFNGVACVAAAILDEINPQEGDEAWRIYTDRPDAWPGYKGSPKPTG